MPDNFEWNFGVPVFDRSKVAEKIVALGGVVVQPTHNVLHRRGIDIHHGLSPDDFDPLNRRAELLLQRLGARISCRSTPRDVFLGDGLTFRESGARAYDFESTHGADLVWCTELPNGSPSSSINEGGM